MRVLSTLFWLGEMSMPSLNELPADVDRREIARAIQQIFKDLSESSSLPVIVENVNRVHPIGQISVNALKLFLRRPVSKRINSRNSLLPALYHYIQIHFGRMEEPAQSTAQQFAPLLRIVHTGTDSGRLTSLAKRAYEWLRIEPKDIQALASKLAGTNFVLLRKSSVYPEIVIKSLLSIKLNEKKDALEGVHMFTDRIHQNRISRGFFAPVNNNLYGILAVEEQEALEILGFSIPLTHGAIGRMTGVAISVDLQRALLSAKTFLELESKIWEKVPSRFSVREEPYCSNAYIMEKVKLLDEGPSSAVPA